jgi:hypothetical protein
MAGPIEQLKQTRWWKPAVRRYAEHLIANKRQRCQRESLSFLAFVNDILSTPAHLRDDLLKSEDPEAAELARLQNQPSVRYGQYGQPSSSELKIGLTLRPPKRRKSCGSMSQTPKRSRIRKNASAAKRSSSPKLKPASKRRSTRDSKS